MENLDLAQALLTGLITAFVAFGGIILNQGWTSRRDRQIWVREKKATVYQDFLDRVSSLRMLMLSLPAASETELMKGFHDRSEAVDVASRRIAVFGSADAAEAAMYVQMVLAKYADPETRRGDALKLALVMYTWEVQKDLGIKLTEPPEGLPNSRAEVQEMVHRITEE